MAWNSSGAGLLRNRYGISVNKENGTIIMQLDSIRFNYTSKRQRIYHFLEGFFSPYILGVVLIAIFARVYNLYDGVNIAGWVLFLLSAILIIFLFRIRRWTAIGLSISIIVNVLINCLIFLNLNMPLSPLGYLFIPPPLIYLVGRALSPE